nr:amidohydrolase [Desulfobacterales bacterium]
MENKKNRIIDFHVHPTCKEFWIDTVGPYAPAIQKSVKIKRLFIRSEEEMVRVYQDLNMMAVLVAWDAETATGLPSLSNDWIAGLVKRHPDTFIGFASIDPWKGKMAIDELERAVKDLGLKGVKFQQGAQAFYPNDKRFYPLWEKCLELNIPVQFHTGTTGLGEGLAGGQGIKLDYMKPIPYIDEVAADFPDLKIVCLHPSWPWQEETLAMAKHKGNVYVDLSGHLPSRFPDSLKEAIGTYLRKKAIFSTDFPAVEPAKWLADFEGLGLSEDVKEDILIKNSRRLLEMND